MNSFECLYLLENSYMQIIEVKSMAIQKNADPSQRFKWLRVEKESLEISKLDFASMDSSGEIEERYFDQGYLKFNTTTGTFIEKYNSAQHPLDRRIDFRIPTALENAISEFLQGHIG